MPKGVNKDGYRMMASWTAGECDWCGKGWPKGKQIWWHPQWKVAVCCPQHGIPRQMATYASRRAARGVPSTPMRRQGGTQG
jgi:hypothetical protein